MIVTSGFSGLTFNRPVAVAVMQYRAVSLVSGTDTLMPHVGTGPALGIAMQSGAVGQIIQVMEYGTAIGEFDNTPILGHVAGLNGDKMHDLGTNMLSGVSTTLGAFGGIRVLRPDLGPFFAEFLVLAPANTGNQVQYANIAGTPAPQQTGTVTLDFGGTATGEGDYALTIIPATWVTSSSVIAIQSAGIASVDHDPEDALIEGIITSITNMIPGVGFSIQAYAVEGTWGRYTMGYSGA